jgi:anti-sigma B factor antagonist
MNLPTEIFGQVVVVHSPEELSTDHAAGFESFLRTVEPHNVVLDMDNTELLDSAGLTAIVDAQDQLRERDGDIKIATNNASNRKILEITRLDQQLEVFDSVIDAVKSYQN